MFDPRRHAVRPDLADSRLSNLLPDDHPVVDGALEQVIAPVVPLFVEPNARSARASEVLLGEQVMVFEDREGFSWCQVQADSSVGYIPTAALSPDVVEPSHRVGALRSFVYAAPDPESSVSAALSMGAQTQVAGAEVGGFRCIGPDEWVFMDHLVTIDHRVSDPVAVAEMFLHTPFLNGGRSSLGLDGAGLVQLAFAACGRSLPREADLQAAEPLDWLDDCAGRDWEGGRRGDLVFWDAACHAGIMVGSQHIIHASAQAMAVVVEPIAQAVVRIESSGGGRPTQLRRPT